MPFFTEPTTTPLQPRGFFLQSGAVTIHQGEALAVLETLPSDSIHCCITSPPYYRQRDYGTAHWVGGDPACSHEQGRPGAGRADGVVDQRRQRNRDGVNGIGGDCRKCGALRVDSQIGVEDTPQQYIDKLVAVFHEVRRVLHPSGVLWLNLGDSYAGSGYANHANTGGAQRDDGGKPRHLTGTGVGSKNLLMIPARVALALQQDGWCLRADIIWHKRNPMPESATDRPTNAHEYVFLLTKRARYFYDAIAVREPATSEFGTGIIAGEQKYSSIGRAHSGWMGGDGETRNLRDVWTFANETALEEHFAVMPSKLAEICVKAGSSERGCCPHCRAPWVWEGSDWAASCKCPLHNPVPCVVLDPFGGIGTTGLVAAQLARHATLIELKPDYIRIAQQRLDQDGIAVGMARRLFRR